MSFDLRCGDCVDGLLTLADGTVDALVTDPPAGIGFMGKEWDRPDGGDAPEDDDKTLTDGERFRKRITPIFVETLRTLKPGAHGLVWALPRTSHWTATALEDAGFEIRDVITHHFGSGFPKSLDVSKAIDKAAGAERVVIGSKVGQPGYSLTKQGAGGVLAGRANGSLDDTEGECAVTAPATDAAKQWSGWGTALKPGSEHWILVRKPLIGTVAANVQEHGTGALNIDACRIEGTGNRTFVERTKDGRRDEYRTGSATGSVATDIGRWPANVLLSHSAACEDGPCADDCPVRTLDAQSGTSRSTVAAGVTRYGRSGGIMGEVGALRDGRPEGHDDEGGASRFFYCAKPSTAEREAGLLAFPRVAATELVGRKEGAAALQSPRTGAGRTSDGRANIHPTVKSIALMEWLVKLITPPRGLVLDPFAGSGTTGIAAFRLGHRFVGWEKDPTYHAIAMVRINAARGAQLGFHLGGAA